MVVGAGFGGLAVARALSAEPVDVTRLLVEAVSDARVLAPGHQWRLDLPEEAVEVTGDEQRLHQVVTNLLTNARKYTPPGTTVTAMPRASASRTSGKPGSEIMGMPASVMSATAAPPAIRPSNFSPIRTAVWSR